MALHYPVAPRRSDPETNLAQQVDGRHDLIRHRASHCSKVLVYLEDEIRQAREMELAV